MNSTIRKVVFFVALVGLAYISHARMIKPANLEMANQRAKLLGKQAKLEKLNSAPEATEELTGQLERLSEAVTFFESKLPPASQIDAVLQNVTVIARKNNLTSKVIRTLKTKQNNGYIELPLKMELSGDFNAYYSFLLELEQLDRITKIRDLSLKKVSKEQGQIEASFIISIFFQDVDA
jgi:type IV pilus assembly protein PilO